MGFKKGNKGKPKGAKNKSTQLVEETAARLGLDPFEILCLFAKGDWKALGYDAEMYFVEKAEGAVTGHYVVTSEMRLKAAQEACKYLYSTKKAVEISTGEDGIKLTIQDYTKS